DRQPPRSRQAKNGLPRPASMQPPWPSPFPRPALPDCSPVARERAPARSARELPRFVRRRCSSRVPPSGAPFVPRPFDHITLYRRVSANEIRHWTYISRVALRHLRGRLRELQVEIAAR